MDQLSWAAVTADVHDRVRILSDGYNYPLRHRRSLDRRGGRARPRPDRPPPLPALVPHGRRAAKVDPPFDPGSDRYRWLAERLPLEPEIDEADDSSAGAGYSVEFDLLLDLRIARVEPVGREHLGPGGLGIAGLGGDPRRHQAQIGSRRASGRSPPRSPCARLRSHPPARRRARAGCAAPPPTAVGRSRRWPRRQRRRCRAGRARRGSNRASARRAAEARSRRSTARRRAAGQRRRRSGDGCAPRRDARAAGGSGPGSVAGPVSSAAATTAIPKTAGRSQVQSTAAAANPTTSTASAGPAATTAVAVPRLHARDRATPKKSRAREADDPQLGQGLEQQRVRPGRRDRDLRCSNQYGV